MIRVQNLHFSYSGAPVFDGAEFVVGQNQRVGLVGPNGAGKSTLFKLLLGKESESEGKIEVSGNVGFVPQEVKKDDILQKSTTIREYIDPDNTKEDYELQTILNGLELSHIDLYAMPKVLSGGQKTKLALARVLIVEPDVLLLDEPTNFLDTQGKKWVMKFLSSYPKTLLLVSHDLSLMDQAIDKVIVIDPFTYKIKEYTGTYTQYKRLKAEHDVLLKRKFINEQKHIKRIKKAIEGMAGRKSEKGVRQRIQLQKRVEKMEANLPEMPKELAKIKISLPEPIWVGEIPLKAVGIGKAYGANAVLEDVSLTLYRGERVVLIGHNGAGKSTLLKILVGLLKPDTGEIIKDEKLKIGYYSQEFETFDQEQTLLEVVQEKSVMDIEKIRAFLARFLFRGEKVYQKIHTLSGGEKTRLAMGLLMLQDSNVLILDEPTTYLDPLSQRIILEAVKEYKGTMLVVSHTQDFIKELTPKRALLLPENEVRDFKPELLEKVSEI